MEGGGFFPFGGDPEEILRGLRDFAEQQAEGVKDTQREQFATLTLSHRRRADAGRARADHADRDDRRAGAPAARRDARPVPRGGRARLSRPPGLHARIGSARVRLFDRAVVAPAPGGATLGRAQGRGAVHRRADARRRRAASSASSTRRAYRDRGRARRGRVASRMRETIAAAYHDALAAIAAERSTRTSRSS